MQQLACDGVLRSYSSSGEVVDYRQLSPEEIDLALKSMEGIFPSDHLEKTVEKMRGVDGRNVTDLEQLLHPGPEIRN